MTTLSGWENFYVIVGSSAGALIGLQFVVITLIADMPRVRDNPQAGAAFGTPTVIHFGSVLLLSAIVSAPWPGLGVVELLWGVMGVTGIMYAIIVIRRMLTQTLYKPEFEDWLFHAWLPFAAYATLAGSAVAARSHLVGGLFGIGAAALLLLFVGIHNAWDAITYHVYVQRNKQTKAEHGE